jgi:molybdopterin converting factor subunit 1
VHGGKGPRVALPLRVLYFAALRDLSGTSEEELELELGPGPAALPTPLDVSGLLDRLEQRHAALRGRLDAVRVAVNEEFVERTAELHGGEVVALIPPVSGG